MTEQPSPSRKSTLGRKSITETPAYWVYLFCTAGLIGLLLAQPKFAARQAQVERKLQGRQRAVQNMSGEQPRTPLSDESHTAIQLRPLYYVLGGILMIAWGHLAWNRFFSKSRC